MKHPPFSLLLPFTLLLLLFTGTTNSARVVYCAEDVTECCKSQIGSNPLARGSLGHPDTTLSCGNEAFKPLRWFRRTHLKWKGYWSVRFVDMYTPAMDKMQECCWRQYSHFCARPHFPSSGKGYRIVHLQDRLGDYLTACEGKWAKRVMKYEAGEYDRIPNVNWDENVWKTIPRTEL